MPRNAHYLVSTHWDREYYQTFQGFRYRLVELLDRVIDALLDGTLRGSFYLDGQTSPLDDYLEIRRDRTDVVRGLLAEGRLVIGPWFTMPDFFSVGGESLVRNLELGVAESRRLGAEASRIVNCCDVFGFPGQTPQLFAQFDMRTALIWRGLNHTDHRMLNWRGVDGTVFPTFRFGLNGYWAYSVQVRRHANWRHEHTAESFAEDLEAFLQREGSATPAGAPLLLFDGADHAAWDSAGYENLGRATASGALSCEIVHGHPDAWVDELLAAWDQDAPTIDGEQYAERLAAYTEEEHALLPNTLSNRVNIKLRNAECESALLHWAEPMHALAHLVAGMDAMPDLFRESWRLLLQNHFHDTICGSSHDDAHHETAGRFRQSRQIAEAIGAEAMSRLAVRAENAGDVSSPPSLWVFNPLPEPRRGVFQSEISLPDALAGRLRVVGRDGDAVEQQWTRVSDRGVQVTTFPAKSPLVDRDRQLWRVAVETSAPALGFAGFRLVAGNSTTDGATMARGERGIENERLRVEFADDCTLTLHDKVTGENYVGLLRGEDLADKGNAFNFGPLAGDEPVEWTPIGVVFGRAEDGPLVSTMVVRFRIAVPEAMVAGEAGGETAGPAVEGLDSNVVGEGTERSRTLVELAIELAVTLRRGEAACDVVATIRNPARDHRLRFLFPTGCRNAIDWQSDSAFDSVTRPIRPAGHRER